MIFFWSASIERMLLMKRMKEKAKYFETLWKDNYFFTPTNQQFYCADSIDVKISVSNIMLQKNNSWKNRIL